MAVQSGLLTWRKVDLSDFDAMGQLAAIEDGAEQRFSENCLLHVRLLPFERA